MRIGFVLWLLQSTRDSVSNSKNLGSHTVGIWSARTEKKPRFLIALLGFSGGALIAHNPEGSDGSAAGGG